MKVTSEKMPDSQVLLHIEVEPERSAKSIEQAYRRLVGKANIPGFRKGKAPRHIVERMIGLETLVHEGVDILLPEVYREALAETGIEPIAEPQVDVVQEQPLVVNMTVPVRPTVEIGDYHDVHAEREQVTVKDEDVDKVLERLREQHAEWLPVERAAAAEDRVTMDVTGHVRGAPVLYNPQGSAILESKTGEPVVDQKGVEYTVTPESPVPVKGFAEQIIGMHAAEHKGFELNFPSDYPDKQLANKAVIFDVTVHDVKEKQLPSLDDEFAKTVGDFETLDALRQSVVDNLRQHAERDAENRLAEQVIGTVADRAQIALPPQLIEREIDRLSERFERNLRQSQVNIEEYLRASNKSKEELRTDLRADAIANLRRFLVLDEIAKAENLEVSPEEIEAEIDKMGAALGELGGRVTEALRTESGRENLSEEIRHRKALARLVAIATGATAESGAGTSGAQADVGAAAQAVADETALDGTAVGGTATGQPASSGEAAGEAEAE